MSLFGKEWRIYLRDGRAVLLLLALGGLFLAAACMTSWEQGNYRRAAMQAAKAEYTRWLAQPQKFAHSAAHYGMWALKAPPPLAAADPGISAFVGSAVWMEAHLQNELLYRPAQDAGVSERFGTLSPAVVIGVFAPLLLLLMGFGAVAREREQGVWTLAMVQGQSVRAVLTAKTLALAVLALLALVPGLITILWFVAANGGHSEWWLRFALWLLGVVLYMFVVAALVVALSAAASHSARALGIGLAVWVLAMVLVPRLANGVAASASPLQTQQAFSRELKHTLAEPNEAGTRQLEAMQQRLLAENSVTDVSKLPVNLLGTRIQISEEHSNEIFDRYWQLLFDDIDQQRLLARWIGAISPATSFRALSQTLAGSDFTQHRAFVTQAETQRRLMQRLMNEEIERHPDVDGQRHLSDASVWQSVPAFEFRLPSVSALARWWLQPLLMLGGWLLILGLLFRWLARREMKGEVRGRA